MQQVTLVLASVGLTVLAVGQFIDAQNGLMSSKLEYTKTICRKAHGEFSGASEELCGQMQDETNTEYLCNNTGSYCWLEVK